MESINLSKLVLSPHFLTLLEEENIQYDSIISDNKELSQSSGIQLIESHLETFFLNLIKIGIILLFWINYQFMIFFHILLN